MTCIRCHRSVPPDRIACDCYVLRADREQRSLALSRFLAGEAPLFLHRGHVFPDRRQCTSMCGQAVITGKKDDWRRVERVTGSTFDAGAVECEACRDVVMAAAGGGMTDDIQEICNWCAGTGAVCEECGDPKIRCECGPETAMVDCPECDGTGEV